MHACVTEPALNEKLLQVPLLPAYCHLSVHPASFLSKMLPPAADKYIQGNYVQEVWPNSLCTACSCMKAFSNCVGCPVNHIYSSGLCKNIAHNTLQLAQHEVMAASSSRTVICIYSMIVLHHCSLDHDVGHTLVLRSACGIAINIS